MSATIADLLACSGKCDEEGQLGWSRAKPSKCGEEQWQMSHRSYQRSTVSVTRWRGQGPWNCPRDFRPFEQVSGKLRVMAVVGEEEKD
jgi:hypothetical protein